MAARYVNQTNEVAESQNYYTGLKHSFQYCPRCGHELLVGGIHNTQCLLPLKDW